MKDRNVPVLDGRYWVAILVASVLGTTFGDFISEDLGLQYAGALLPLGAVFATVLLLERRAKITTVAWYWVAVVIFRSTATNLGDFISRTLKLGYGGVSVALGILLVAFVFITTRSSASAAFTRVAGMGRKLLTVDSRYWAALLIASVFGTTFGDWVSDDTGLGFGRASLLLGALLAMAVIVEIRAKTPSDARYWAIIALVRTTGTATGDFLSEGGPHLGFALGAILAAAVLVIILITPWLLTYPPEVGPWTRREGASGPITALEES
jgi:uncharacterized membrane-anchored protein